MSTPDKAASPVLSAPQRALLDEMTQYGGIYIRRSSRYYRTIAALRDKGLVRCDERDFSSLGMDHYVTAPENTDSPVSP